MSSALNALFRNFLFHLFQLIRDVSYAAFDRFNQLYKMLYQIEYKVNVHRLCGVVQTFDGIHIYGVQTY